ncbi:hypothetical protein L0Z72_09795, partial [candidate division KSB1 bacterium]|nr:hypothetical protein [candidate division KSB1 bacterium]
MKIRFVTIVVRILIAVVLIFTTASFTQVKPDSMLYEVAQTNPDISAIPPTPQGGFGSTNGGALGMMNVQKYIRVDANQGSNNIVGKWLSTGKNVAPLLATYFNIDSIHANFREDLTYTVRQVDILGVSTVLEGTYQAQAGGVGNINNIVVNQSSPTVLTAQGIFEIFV